MTRSGLLWKLARSSLVKYGCPLGILLHAPRAAEDRTGFVRQTHMFGTQTADSQRAWPACRGGFVACWCYMELAQGAKGKLSWRANVSWSREVVGNSLEELMYRGVVKLCETLLKS